jgi:aminoglycoside phosphotransferase (APT) family kinase protein
LAATVYSERLGAIDDDQLDAAARRLGVGRFVSAAPVASGLFGQNLFLTTTEGEYVLRGAPHWVNGAPNDAWQFSKEIYFARLVHEHTDVPVPWPMLHDPSSDIFGWPYVVMPRLRGLCLNDRTAKRTLPAADREAIAAALGDALARLQRLRWPVAGEVDVNCAFAAYPHGHARHLADEIVAMAAVAAANGAIDDEDRAWIDAVIGRGCAAPADARGATYVHADYKLDNLVVDRRDGGWAVTGLFDFHTACMGIGALDLCRQAASYSDTDPPCATAFVAAWRRRVDVATVHADVLALCAVNERMKIWEYFTRAAHRADWTRGTTFRAFARGYVDRLLELLR